MAAAVRKRSSSRSGTRARKAAKKAQSLGISPVLSFFLILLGAMFVYSAKLEFDGGKLPDAAVAGFIENDADLEIHFIDVEQGDCSLILYNGAAMLVDCGEAEEAGTVISYLEDLGVKKLDYVIATHPHSDHMGGMSEIIRSFDIGKIIVPRVKDELTPDTKVYENFLAALKEKSLKLTAAKYGNSYTLGEADPEKEGELPPAFEILAPIGEYDDLNNYSVVFRLTYGSTSYLFTGDAEKTAENDILEAGYELDSDVLKVGHHGSSTSTGKKFLEAVSPDICIIQCGDGNSYGHPHAETLDAIKDFGAEIYITAQSGNITVYSDGDRIIAKPDKEKE